MKFQVTIGQIEYYCGFEVCFWLPAYSIAIACFQLHPKENYTAACLEKRGFEMWWNMGGRGKPTIVVSIGHGPPYCLILCCQVKGKTAEQRKRRLILLLPRPTHRTAARHQLRAKRDKFILVKTAPFVMPRLLTLCRTSNGSTRLTRKPSFHERWEFFRLRTCIDYRCNNKRFWLPAQNCQVPTPTSRILEVQQQIWIFRAD